MWSDIYTDLMKRLLFILFLLTTQLSFAQVGSTNVAGGSDYVFLPACDEIRPGVFKSVLRLFSFGRGQTLKFVDEDMLTYNPVNMVDSGCQINVMVRGVFSTNKNKACFADNGDTAEGYLITIYIDSLKSTTVIEDLQGNAIIGASEVPSRFCAGTVSVQFDQYLDAFGRLRVSNPLTLFDATHLYDKQPTLFDEIVTGSATSTHIPDESVVNMSVSSDNDRVIRQSFRYFVYQPAKSFFISLTGTLIDTATEDVICRIGLFDDHNDKTIDQGGNGYFVEYSGDSLFVVERSFVTGSQIDTKIPVHLWNLSQPPIDPTKANNIIIDAQWSGVGRVRIGFNINGANVWVHAFNHANSLPSTYTSRITLPIRYEIEQVGDTGGVMKMICSSVMSEGGHGPTGKFRTDQVASLSISSGVETPVLAIRSQAGFNRMSFRIVSASLANSNNANILLKFYSASSTTGGSYVAIPNSGVETNTGVVSFSGGVSITSLFSFGLVRSADLTTDNQRLLTGSDIQGNPQIILITLTPTTNTSIFLTANWQEIY